MKCGPSRRPLRRGPQFDSLGNASSLTHGLSFAAIEAHLIKLEMAAVPAIHAGHPGTAAQLAAPAATDTGTGTGGFQPVSNTFSNLDINSNYIGGSIGLQSFVDGLGLNILHRRGRHTRARRSGPGALEAGRFTPYTVVNFFLLSSEAIGAGGSGQMLRPSHPPANIYTGYLGGHVGVKAFVDGLYADVLHSAAPDPAGVAYWTGQIEKFDLLPAKITFTFLASAEFQSHPTD